MNTGKPTIPSKNHTSPIKNDSVTGKSSAMRKIIKFINVIFGAIGSGVGMLRYAETHKIAANNPQSTSLLVEIKLF